MKEKSRVSVKQSKGTNTISEDFTGWCRRPCTFRNPEGKKCPAFCRRPPGHTEDHLCSFGHPFR